MAKESKGTKVKSFTAHIPTGAGDRDHEKIVVPIYFRAKDSTFAAYLPEHIAEGAGKHPEHSPRYRDHEKAVVSDKADDIEPAFEAMTKLWRRIQQNVAKKKVIQVFVQANARGNRYQNVAQAGFVFKEISFVQGPALNIWHRVLWQIGDGLYNENDYGDGSLPRMSYTAAVSKPDGRPGSTRESFLLDWTQEREDFFDNMREGLLTLIERIAFMLGGDTGDNVDRMISGGGLLSLPAPAGDQDDDL
jgi:hypothetical protein